MAQNNTRKTKSQGQVTASTQQKKMKLDENSPFYLAFSSYQKELDNRNDKYERLVKISRDITIQSKRAIFSLLRREESSEKLIDECKEKFEAIKKLLSQICDETKNEDPYKFARAVSPGIQEFIEAVTLMYYIKERRLVKYGEVFEEFFSFDTNKVLLTHTDYMLGVADLTGELMRMAINRIGSREFIEAEYISEILRSIYQDFAVFAQENRDIYRKLGVMKASVNKVERACYNVKVRGSEIPDHMLGDMLTGDLDDME